MRAPPRRMGRCKVSACDRRSGAGVFSWEKAGGRFGMLRPHRWNHAAPRLSNNLGTAGVFSYRPAHAHRNDSAIEIAFAGKEAPADFRVVGRSVRRARHGAGTRKRTWRAARKVSGEPGDRAELE